MNILNGINQIKSMELNECLEWDKSNIIKKKIHSFYPSKCHYPIPFHPINLNILNGINQIKSMELNECLEWDKSNIIEKKYIHFIPQNAIIPFFFTRLIVIHFIPYITKKDYSVSFIVYCLSSKSLVSCDPSILCKIHRSFCFLFIVNRRWCYINGRFLDRVLPRNL